MLLHGKVLTSYSKITEDERRDEEYLIRENFLLDEEDVIKAYQLLTNIKLFDFKMPVTMIYRGDDQRLNGLMALEHEEK